MRHGNASFSTPVRQIRGIPGFASSITKRTRCSLHGARTRGSNWWRHLRAPRVPALAQGVPRLLVPRAIRHATFTPCLQLQPAWPKSVAPARRHTTLPNLAPMRSGSRDTERTPLSLSGARLQRSAERSSTPSTPRKTSLQRSADFRSPRRHLTRV